METTTVESTRTPVVSVTITRWEGFEEELITRTFEGPEACALAGAELRAWARTAPEPGSGYDKCGFRIVWEDGGSYEGRYDLQRDSAADLGAQARGLLQWVARGEFGAERAEEARRMLDTCDLGAW